MAKRFTLVLLTTLLLAGLAPGQSLLGAIGGTVTDASGAAVAKAPVKLTEITTGFSRASVTNATGYYFFPDLPPGTYQVSVSAPGFKEVRSSAITLTAQQSARFDAKLPVGDAKETVEVKATAPTLNTENAQLGSVLARDELLGVPINTRSSLAFVFLTSSNYQGDGSSTSLGGLRNQNTNFTIDGVTSNSSIFGGRVGPMSEETLESVREVKMLSSNNSAEFPNVGTIIISGRSGENQFHGGAFFETSNWALDANPDYFYGGPKSDGFRRHRWGGSFGGPVLLPGYEGHNKTFFYFTFEQQRYIETDPTSGYVPTTKMQQGDFSELLPGTPIVDPATGLPFPGNIIPANRISPVALKFQSFGFLQPNTANPTADLFGGGNWQGIEPVSDHDNRWVGRGDHRFNDHDTLSARVSVRQIPEPPQYWADLTIFQYLQHRHTDNIYASETHIFGPRLVNEARFGYSRDYSTISGAHKGAAVIQQTGLQGINADPTLSGVPQLYFSNFSSMFELSTYFWRSKTFDLLDNISWSHGRHGIKAGVLVRKNLPGMSENLFTPDFGNMSFDGFATGYDYADFLLGLPQTTRRYVRSRPSDYRYTNTGLFVQDDFQVTRNLTLNLGLRWEYFSPPVDTHDMRFSFDPATGNLVVPNQTVLNTLVSPIFPSNIPIVTAQAAGFPARSLLNSNWKNFSPRIGFAYRLLGGNTVIRGGYGIYYSPLVSTLLFDSFSGGPFHSDEYFTNSITDGTPLFQFPNPFPGVGAIPTQSITPAAKSLKTPKVQQWNLTVERELPGAIVARISYRGFLSLQIPYVRDLNTPYPSTDPANENLYKYPNFSQVLYAADGGIQKMHAMDVGLERKYKSGLTFQFGWTWAKNLSDVGDDGESAGIENPYNRQAEMGNVDWMPRHRVIGQMLYEIPFGKGKRFGSGLPGYAQQALGNWQISVVSLYQTGQFLTPYFCGSDPSNTRTFCGRPDRVGDGNLSNPTIQKWFDKTAFVVPPDNAGRFGNSPRGILIGPGTVNTDFGLFKNFKIGERARLQIRMTATNFFNHPNFANPRSLNINSSRFGKITRLQGRRGDTFGAGTRNILMGIRLDF